MSKCCLSGILCPSAHRVFLRHHIFSSRTRSPSDSSCRRDTAHVLKTSAAFFPYFNNYICLCTPACSRTHSPGSTARCYALASRCLTIPQLGVVRVTWHILEFGARQTHCYYTPLIGSIIWLIYSCHLQWLWMTLKVIRLMQDLSNAIRRTFENLHFTRMNISGCKTNGNNKLSNLTININSQHIQHDEVGDTWIIQSKTIFGSIVS